MSKHERFANVSGQTKANLANGLCPVRETISGKRSFLHSSSVTSAMEPGCFDNLRCEAWGCCDRQDHSSAEQKRLKFEQTPPLLPHNGLSHHVVSQCVCLSVVIACGLFRQRLCCVSALGRSGWRKLASHEPSQARSCLSIVRKFRKSFQGDLVHLAGLDKSSPRGVIPSLCLSVSMIP